MKKKQHRTIIISVIALSGLLICSIATVLIFGSGFAYWAISSGANKVDSSRGQLQPANPTFEIVTLPTVAPHTATPTATSTATETATPTFTSTPSPTTVPSDTPFPTDTPLPAPTNTPTPAPVVPTATPPPTDTATPEPPSHPFIIKEMARFDTNHLNFDVYIAIVDSDNKPLSDYRVVGSHSGGQQVESQPSAGDWTVNSGAMHYKGGNLKYEVFNSPAGVWVLQLLNPDGVPVSPPVEFAFDANSPSWYFIIYEYQ